MDTTPNATRNFPSQSSKFNNKTIPEYKFGNKMQSEYEHPHEDDYKIQKSMMFIYFVGRILGIIPFSSDTKNKRNLYSLHFHYISFAFVYSMIVILLVSFLTGMELAETVSHIQRDMDVFAADNGLKLLLLFQIIGCRIFFGLRAPKMLRVLENFIDTERISKRLKRKMEREYFVSMCMLMTFIGVCAVFIEYVNISIYLWKIPEEGNIFYRLTPLKYEYLHKSGWFYIPVMLSTPFLLMSWGFSDVLFMVVATTLRGLFVRYNLFLEYANPNFLSIEDLEDLRDIHRRLSRVVQEVDELFSPLILICYVTNNGYLFTKLYLGLFPQMINEDMFIRWRAIFSFVYQLCRILCPSLMAAALHYQAHRASYILRSWSSSLDGDTTEIASFRISLLYRFTLELQHPQINLSGWGFFHITKPFIMGLLSALATYEFLLVAWQTEKPKFAS